MREVGPGAHEQLARRGRRHLRDALAHQEPELGAQVVLEDDVEQAEELPDAALTGDVGDEPALEVPDRRRSTDQAELELLVHQGIASLAGEGEAG